MVDLRLTRTGLEDGSLDELIDACEGLSSLREHCYAHLVRRRATLWEARGRAVFLDELEVLVARVADLSEMDGVGNNVGGVVVALGWVPWAETPCVAFPKGAVARQRCEGRVRSAHGITVPGAKKRDAPGWGSEEGPAEDR